MSRVDLHDADGEVLSVTRTRPVRPPKYAVVMHNDDYTPADFVVGLLQDVFRMDVALAFATMMAVHMRGSGVCGAYPRDVAETKVSEAERTAAAEGHPLCFSIRPE